MANLVANHVDVAVKECIRVLYPDIRIPNGHVSVELAAFIFSQVARLKFASLATLELFHLYRPVPPQTAAAISLLVAKSIIRIVVGITSKQVRSNAISYALIVAPFARLVQANLEDPDTFPAPDWQIPFRR